MLTDPLSLVSPPLFMAADIRAIDRLWAEAHPDASLMERAGTSAAELALMLASETGEPILVLAGPGNNGGDALVAARLLAAQGIPLTVVSRPTPPACPWTPRTLGRPGVRPAAGCMPTFLPGSASAWSSTACSASVWCAMSPSMKRAGSSLPMRWTARRLALDMPSGLDSRQRTHSRHRACAPITP
jgi:ADP-dependent NAD(P)H-hydrate dehydratase / NAD(P)H-hydrate epimerase